MLRKRVHSLALACLAVVILPAFAAADQAEDEAAIRKNVESYTAAFNAHDAKTLASFWAPEAVYTNPLTGEQVTGQDAIEKAFAAMFETAGKAQLDVEVQGVQFVSPNVAIETGIAKVVRPEGEPIVTEYSAVHVRRDGNWLLDRVSEEDVPVTQTHYEELKELEWMVGTWIDDGSRDVVVTECNWTKNKNFLTRAFTVNVRDRIDAAGMQIIGWDAAAKQIRSWVFDSDGGFAEGTWTRKGDKWFIQQTGTLPNGSKGASTNILTYVDENTCTWQSIDRTVDGQLQPNIEEIRVVRQPLAAE